MAPFLIVVPGRFVVIICIRIEVITVMSFVIAVVVLIISVAVVLNLEWLKNKVTSIWHHPFKNK